MKHEVIKYFKCKESGDYFPLGSFYISDNLERVKHLESLGYIVANSELGDGKTIVKKKIIIDDPRNDEQKQTIKRTRKKKVSDEDVTESEEVTQDK